MNRGASRYQPAQTRRALAFAIVGVLGVVAPSRAGFVASTLGPAQDQYNARSGYNVLGPKTFGGVGYAIAVRFTVGTASAVTFDSAELAMAYRAGTNAATISLAADDGNKIGSTIESIKLLGVPAEPGLVTVSSSLHPLLNPGASYWLLAAYGGPDTSMTWFASTSGAAGHLAYRPDSLSSLGAWSYNNAFVDAGYAISSDMIPAGSSTNAVPAPASALLWGVGALAGWSIRSIRSGRRVAGAG